MTTTPLIENNGPTVVCDAYSGGCETAPPILVPEPTTAGETAVNVLPYTGGYISYGEVILIALALILVGVALVAMLRTRKA